MVATVTPFRRISKNEKPAKSPRKPREAKDDPAAGSVGNRPTPQQRRWMLKGLTQAGGKLALFDESGKRISERTVRSCMEKGWVESWFVNPIKPDWLVCKLTDAGRAVLAADDEA